MDFIEIEKLMTTPSGDSIKVTVNFSLELSSGERKTFGVWYPIHNAIHHVAALRYCDTGEEPTKHLKKAMLRKITALIKELEDEQCLN